MTPEEMDALVEEHVGAEANSDVAAAVAVYTDDIEHDVVGAPGGPLRGPEAAAKRYEALLAEIQTYELTLVRAYHGADFCVVEHHTTCRVNGSFAGVPGNGRRSASGCCTSSSSRTAGSAGRTCGWTPRR